MEINTYPADKRVFRIDDECYIIYLGSHLDDYKPFLRIGNSPRLTKEIIDNIYNIVITESYTGNPTLEPTNVDTHALENIRYVGDRITVERFLDFLKHFKIETEYITYDKEIETRDHNAVLYIYDNGNVTLLYDKDRLFDLKDREKKDLHFIELTRRIKEQFVRNPLRYVSEDFNTPGFLKIKNCILLFEKGGCISFGLPAHYFQSLMQQGIDPDLISAVVTDKASSDFINLCKRKRFVGEHLFILSTDNGPLQGALKLFETGKSNALKYRLEKVAESSEKKISGYNIKRIKRGYLVSHKDIPYPLILGDTVASDKNSYIYIHQKNGISLGPAKRGITFPTAEGIPYIFSKEVPDISDLLRDYVSEFALALNEFFSPEESILIRHLNNFIEDISANRSVQESIGKLKKGIKSLKTTWSDFFPFLLSNIRAICKYLVKEESSDSKKDLEALATAIKKSIGSSFKDGSGVPLVGKCYITSEEIFVFYCLTKKSIRNEDFTLAKDFMTSVQNLSAGNLAFYSDELSRLTQLIRELAVSPPARKAKPTPEPAVPPLPGEAAPSRVKPRGVKKEKKVLSTVLPIIAGVIVVLVALFFLPPLSLYKKTIGERAEKKTLVTTRKEETPVAPLEKEEVREETALAVTERGEDIETQERAPMEEIEGEEVKTGVSISEQKELEEFLSLGYIQITILDVYNLTNKIALSNGYRALDSPEDLKLGKDPDWIYPGNFFMLPDETQYTVVKGDTIWYIAKRFIKRNLDRDWARYQEILKEIERTDIARDRKNALISELKSLKENSYSENFVKEIDKKLNELQ